MAQRESRFRVTNNERSKLCLDRNCLVISPRYVTVAIETKVRLEYDVMSFSRS